jgi:hypothetical protein
MASWEQLRNAARRVLSAPGVSRARAAALLTAITLVCGLAGLAGAGAAQASPATASAARASAARASAASPAASAAWKVEKTPNPSGAVISYLHEVSCTSASACTAVGAYSLKGGSGGSIMAERWNGKAWSIQVMPTPKGTEGDNLYGVSCASASACTAAGSAYSTKAAGDVPLAESWNGKSWRVETTPSPAGGTDPTLYAVSCTSASACTAVGDYMNKAGLPQSLIERWNGKTWAIQIAAKSAKRSWLIGGVSCPTLTACTAVGYQNSGTGDATPLIEGWNGKTWTAQKAALPKGAPGGALDSVSCTSPAACTATGVNFSGTAPTLAERWNGKTWTVQPTPNPSNFTTSLATVELDGVSCTSAKACTAVGSYQPGGMDAYFAEVWNGTAWKLQSTPVPAGSQGGNLLGVSCSTRGCTAVGAYFSSAGQVTLALAS